MLHRREHAYHFVLTSLEASFPFIQLLTPEERGLREFVLFVGSHTNWVDQRRLLRPKAPSACLTCGVGTQSRLPCGTSQGPVAKLALWRKRSNTTHSSLMVVESTYVELSSQRGGEVRIKSDGAQTRVS